jgi:hypothetical protein
MIQATWRRIVSSAMLASILAGCSGMQQSVPIGVSSGGERFAATTATLKTLPYTEVSAGAIQGSTPASRALGVAQWGIFATSDNTVVSVAAFSSTNAVLWSMDLTFTSQGLSQLVTSLGTNVALPSASSANVVVSGKGPALDAQYVDAFKADTNATYGSGPSKPTPGGRQTASTYVPMNGPCCNTLPISIMGFAIAAGATADAIIVGGLVAVGPVGWFALGVAVIALGADLYNEHREYNEHPPTPPGGHGGGGGGGPTLGPPVTGGTGNTGGPNGGGGGQVTHVCVYDSAGNNLGCTLTFYV